MGHDMVAVVADEVTVLDQRDESAEVALMELAADQLEKALPGCDAHRGLSVEDEAVGPPVREVLVDRVRLFAVEVSDDPLVLLAVFLPGLLAGFEGTCVYCWMSTERSAANWSKAVRFSMKDRMKRTPSSKAVKSWRSTPAQMSSESASRFSRTASRSSRISRVRSFIANAPLSESKCPPGHSLRESTECRATSKVGKVPQTAGEGCRMLDVHVPPTAMLPEEAGHCALGIRHARSGFP